MRKQIFNSLIKPIGRPNTQKKRKNQNITKIAAIILIIVGTCLSALLLFTNCDNCSNECKTLLQILSSLGGGMVSSAIVSLLFQKFSDVQEKKRKLEYKTYLFEKLQSALLCMLRNEIRLSSRVFAILERPNTKSTKKLTSQLSFDSAVKCWEEYLNKIENKTDELNRMPSTAIGESNLAAYNKFNDLFFCECYPYYENLHTYLSRITNMREFYLTNELLTSEHISTLDTIKQNLEFTMECCKEKNYDLAISYKICVANSLLELGAMDLINNKTTETIFQTIISD